MLAALTLALQKFNIQARQGAPGFREQRPRPRKRPQSGRKLPKRLRFGHDSDRSRPTSPESGSFYTPASTPTFSPFTTPPQSPQFIRRVISNGFIDEDAIGHSIDPGLDEFVTCQPVQSSKYISLSQPQNGYSSHEPDSDLKNDIGAKAGLQDAPKRLSLEQQPVVQEDAIVAEKLSRAYQPPPVNQGLINQTSQPKSIIKVNQPLPSNRIPVEEPAVDVVQINHLANATPIPSGLGQQETQSSKAQQSIPQTFKQPQSPKLKPPQIDASILSAFSRVQDYFEKHPDHKSLTIEQLISLLAQNSQADEDREVIDQLAKDHQFLLRRFIEQQDSSDDESFADERINRVKKTKTKPTKRLRPADRRPLLGPDWVHATTQTDDEPELPQPPERRPLRLPMVEDLVAAQSKKKHLIQQGKQRQQQPPSEPQKNSAATAPLTYPKAAGDPKPVGKKAKAAKSYEQLVLELKPLVTPVSHSTAAAAGGTAAAPGESADCKTSLWSDVWGSWGVWLIARFSATGQGGDVNEASSEFNKDDYIKNRPTDRHLVSEEAVSNIATMPGPTKEIFVNLYRDTLNTPWGFRLQGGLDFKQPLTVQRVFVGSPADTNLQRGDVILRINNTDVYHLTHKQAQDLVKQAGGELSMSVRRASQEGYGVRSGSPQLVIIPSVPDPGQFRPRPMEAPSGALGFVPALPRYQAQPPQQQTGFSFGHDYNDYKRGGFRVDATPKAPVPKSMLNKLNQSLNQSLWSPGQNEEEVDFKPVSMLKQNFNSGLLSTARGQFDKAELTAGAGDEEDEELNYQGVKELKKAYNRQVKAHEKELKSKKPLPADDRRQAGPMSTGKIWSKPTAEVGSIPCGLSEPGWCPGSGKQQGAGWSSVRPHGSAGTFMPTPVNRPQPVPVNRRPEPVNRQQPGNRNQQGYQVPHIESNEPPAWYGSLRSGGGVRQWEIRAAADITDEGVPHAPVSPGGGQHGPVQSSTLSPRQTSGQASPRSPGGPLSPRQPAADVPVHTPRVQQMSYGPAGQEYRQLAPGENAENASVQHLQYNTPIGLYSKTNVQSVLKSQTSGMPGEGTMQVQGTGGPGAKKEFDPSRSEVLALLQAEESHRPRAAAQPNQAAQQQGHPSQPQQSARYEEERPSYQGYVDHSKQSPSMHALEAHVDTQAPGGFSDF